MIYSELCARITVRLHFSPMCNYVTTVLLLEKM